MLLLSEINDYQDGYSSNVYKNTKEQDKSEKSWPAIERLKPISLKEGVVRQPKTRKQQKPVD